jgi:hypothetical protein
MAANPSIFTDALALEICERIAGGASLKSICEKVDGMPGYATVRRWELTNKEFGEQVRKAREIGCHLLGEECLEIADQAQQTIEHITDPDGTRRVINNDTIAQSRLRIDTRMKLLSKWLPLVYGDKVDVNHGGTIRTEKITRRIIDPNPPPNDDAG